MSKTVTVTGAAGAIGYALLFRLASGQIQVTVLNFSGESITGSVNSSHLEAGAGVRDLFTEETVGQVDDLHSFFIELGAYQGTALLIEEPAAEEEEAEGL